MMKKVYYFIDGLKSQLRFSALVSSLTMTPKIHSVKSNTDHSIIEVTYSGGDPEVYVKKAVERMGLSFRGRLTKNEVAQFKI